MYIGRKPQPAKGAPNASAAPVSKPRRLSDDKVNNPVRDMDGVEPLDDDDLQEGDVAYLDDRVV